MVLQQRTGSVTIDFDAKRSDLTCVDVPTECVGFVTGKSGTVLRTLEQDWGTLMFFADSREKGEGRGERIEKLAIYGRPAARCGAELKVGALHCGLGWVGFGLWVVWVGLE